MTTSVVFTTRSSSLVFISRSVVSHSASRLIKMYKKRKKKQPPVGRPFLLGKLTHVAMVLLLPWLRTCTVGGVRKLQEEQKKKKKKREGSDAEAERLLRRRIRGRKKSPTSGGMMMSQKTGRVGEKEGGLRVRLSKSQENTTDRWMNADQKQNYNF